MNVQFAILADAANKAENGKLNLLGVFDRVTVGSFPAVHMGAVLVARLTYSSLEAEKEFTLDFVFVEEDGKELAAVRGKLQVSSEPKGLNLYTDLIVRFPAMPLPRSGNYRIAVILNGEDKAHVPLLVTNPMEATENDH